MKFKDYKQEIEETKKEMAETWEQIGQERTNARKYEQPFRFGTWKDKDGHECQLFVYATPNPQTKMFEIEGNMSMIDEKHTFETFLANNVSLHVFGIYERKALELEHKYKALQIALNRYEQLQKAAEKERTDDEKRMAAIYERLTEEERLQDEFKQLKHKYETSEE
jgi:hypothetical protein